jgi:hypothetical protein
VASLKIETRQQPSDTWKKLEIAITSLTGKVGKVGWLGGTRYPDDPASGKQGPDVAYIATIQEYGYPAGGIPPRPFVRPSIAKNIEKWRAIALKYSKRVLENNGSVADVFEAVGASAQGDIDKAIVQLVEPPLSPVTIAARLRRRKVGNAEVLAHKVVNKLPLTDKEQKSFGLLDKPLIDTGLMLATLTHTVEDG